MFETTFNNVCSNLNNLFGRYESKKKPNKMSENGCVDRLHILFLVNKTISWVLLVSFYILLSPRLTRYFIGIFHFLLFFLISVLQTGLFSWNIQINWLVYETNIFYLFCLFNTYVFAVSSQNSMDILFA